MARASLGRPCAAREGGCALGHVRREGERGREGWVKDANGAEPTASTGECGSGGHGYGAECASMVSFSLCDAGERRDWVGLSRQTDARV
jgi:hypothetical protein